MFDLDGLLVDTEHLHYEAVSLALLDHKISPMFDYTTYLGLAHSESGLGVKEYIEKLHPEIGRDWEAFRAVKKKHYLELLQTRKIDLKEGVDEVLLDLNHRNILSCVVTNSSREEVLLLQKALPSLLRIKNWITREDYKKAKPEPDGYLKALTLFPSILLSETIGFEDSLRGAKALINAGIRPILVSFSDHPQNSHAGEIFKIFSLKSIL